MASRRVDSSFRDYATRLENADAPCLACDPDPSPFRMMELSSRSLSPSRGARNLSARVETEWFGDEARPWDEAWATDIHRGVLHSFKWMAGEKDSYPQFFKRLARNAQSGLYEEASTMEDNMKIIKNLGEEFNKEHKRYPTFWFDKCCIDQTNIV